MLLLGSGEGKTFSRAGEREEREREGEGRGLTTITTSKGTSIMTPGRREAKQRKQSS